MTKLNVILHKQITQESTITIAANTNAGKNGIQIDYDDNGTLHIRVNTTKTPENNQANEDIIKQLAKALGIAKSRLTIIRGVKSKCKTLKIN